MICLCTHFLRQSIGDVAVALRHASCLLVLVGRRSILSSEDTRLQETKDVQAVRRSFYNVVLG